MEEGRCVPCPANVVLRRLARNETLGGPKVDAVVSLSSRRNALRILVIASARVVISEARLKVGGIVQFYLNKVAAKYQLLMRWRLSEPDASESNQVTTRLHLS